MLLRVLLCFSLITTVVLADEKKEEAKTPAEPVFKEFAPKETKFKLLFPGEPVASDVRASTMKAKAWRIDEKTHGFAFMVIDLPESVLKKEDRTPEQQLEGALQGAFWFATPSKDDIKKVRLADKYPGLETTGTLKGDDRQLRIRTYLVDTQLVHLIVLGKPEVLNGETAKKFLDSLSVTNAK
jgi:hypothetical protein